MMMKTCPVESCNPTWIKCCPTPPPVHVHHRAPDPDVNTRYGMPVSFSLRKETRPVPLLDHFFFTGSSCLSVAWSVNSTSMASAPSISTSAGASSSTSSSSSSPPPGVAAAVPLPPKAKAPPVAGVAPPNENAGVLLGAPHENAAGGGAAAAAAVAVVDAAPNANDGGCVGALVVPLACCGVAVAWG